MRSFIYMTALACLGTLALASVPTTTQADDYWDGYWSWYDGSYRPYYYRQGYYAPRYSYGYPGYGGYQYGGYGYPYDTYYGGSRYYGGNYYGTPNVGYRDFQGGGGQVRVGPLRFGWR
jgi:hypothetical protein